MALRNLRNQWNPWFLPRKYFYLFRCSSPSAAASSRVRNGMGCLLIRCFSFHLSARSFMLTSHVVAKILVQDLPSLKCLHIKRWLRPRSSIYSLRRGNPWSECFWKLWFFLVISLLMPEVVLVFFSWCFCIILIMRNFFVPVFTVKWLHVRAMSLPSLLSPSTATFSKETTFRLNFRVSSQTSVITSFKSSPSMVIYDPTIADQLSVFFLHFPLQSSYATYVWSGCHGVQVVF